MLHISGIWEGSPHLGGFGPQMGGRRGGGGVISSSGCKIDLYDLGAFFEAFHMGNPSTHSLGPNYACGWSYGHHKGCVHWIFWVRPNLCVRGASKLTRRSVCMYVCMYACMDVCIMYVTLYMCACAEFDEVDSGMDHTYLPK